MVDIPSPPETGKNEFDAIDRWVGICVVLLATFLGLGNVKDGNIVQQMQLKLVDRNNDWAWFQARNIRQAVYEATADELSLPYPGESSEVAEVRQAKAAAYRERARDQGKKMDELQSKAKTSADAYNRLNERDDQFDLCEAALSLALAMMGVTALTKRWSLFWMALIPAAFGVAMGLAGFLEWDTGFEAVRWFMQLLS